MTVIIGLVPIKDTISFNTFDFLGGEKRYSPPAVAGLPG